FVAPVLPQTAVDQLGFLLVIGAGAALVLIQLYRYRRVSSPLQRQQTKWVVFGFAVAITLNVLQTLLALLFPLAVERNGLALVAATVVHTCLPLFIPLSFGCAMLRS